MIMMTRLQNSYTAGTRFNVHANYGFTRYNGWTVGSTHVKIMLFEMRITDSLL